MPKHIALIIDGNGRWAKLRNLTRSDGHKKGFENLKLHIEFIKDLGIKNLSVYCFSSENWNRPKDEVDCLMNLFDEMLDMFKKEYLTKDIRIIISGNLCDLRIPKNVRDKAIEIMDLTKHKTSFILNACINYGGRNEILRAVNSIIEDKIANVTEEEFEKYLYTSELLPVDFVIRTSGEQRTSNFMPWQTTYSEWYFPRKFWPGFKKRDLLKAIKEYLKRNRRFGSIK